VGDSSRPGRDSYEPSGRKPTTAGLRADFERASSIAAVRADVGEETVAVKTSIQQDQRARARQVRSRRARRD
jgi:hypothetical protein